MTVTWKQIDTNGNGYVDGNEAKIAKQKGIKNVWDNMTAADYENNTSRSAKISEIVSANMDHSNFPKHYSNCFIGYTEEERQKIMKEKKESIEARLLELNRKNEQYSKQIESYRQQMKEKLDAIPNNITDAIAEKYYEAKYWIKANFFHDYEEGEDDNFVIRSKKYISSNLAPERQKRISQRKQIEDTYRGLIADAFEAKRQAEIEMSKLADEYVYTDWR